MNDVRLTRGGGFAPQNHAFDLHHVGDLVDRINALELDAAIALLDSLPVALAGAVLDQSELDRRDELILAPPPHRAVRLIDAMSADQAAALLDELPEEVRERLLPQLARVQRSALERITSFPEDSAGRMMTTEFVHVPDDWTVGQTMEHIRRNEDAVETVYAIHVLDRSDDRLLRVIGLRRLVCSDPALPVVDAAPPIEPITVSPYTDRSDVARIISKYNLLAVPVVEEGQMLGIVTVDDVIDSIAERQTEVVQRMGGVEALDEPYMRTGFLAMLTKRAGWLCVLFLSEMLTASAMQHFEDEIEKAVVLSLFIPLIMSSGGNSGSQATSLIIRALALGEVKLADWWRVAMRELPSGLVLGGILGTIAAVRIAVWQLAGIYDYGPHWGLVLATVSSTLVAIVTFGSISGSMLPFALKRLGFDPASASAPFIATLVDVSGLVIYFSIALVILSGTLL